jgi:hypothetical protein
MFGLCHLGHIMSQKFTCAKNDIKGALYIKRSSLAWMESIQAFLLPTIFSHQSLAHGAPHI